MIKENSEGDDEVHSAMLQTKKEKGKIVDLSVFMIPQYCVLVASFTLMFLCRFIPNIHLVSHIHLLLYMVLYHIANN